MLPPVSSTPDTAEEVPDADLLAAVGAGERGEPLRILYARYAGRIYGLGVQLLGDRGLAEELVRESFVRLWRIAGRFDPAQGSAPTFIFTIARNLAVDLWRRPSSRPIEPEPAPPPADDQVDSLLARLEVREALNSLTGAHREVLELSYERHLKQAEIADLLGIPVGTVKTRTFHALRALKTALQKRGVDA
jgi:RNA polymerase sigma-70 factor (ECF subfamily)